MTALLSNLRAVHRLAPGVTFPPAPTVGVLVAWLGQAGFALRSRDAFVVVDPYLSDSLAAKYAGTRYPHRRLHPAPVEPEGLVEIDAVLCTHRHTDHMDPETLTRLAKATCCRFLVPSAWVERVIDFGIDAARVTGIDAGEVVDLGQDVQVRAVLAAHEEVVLDEQGRSEFLGYVLAVGGITFYHSGDCVPYDGMTQTLAGLNVDVALLPVNGRDRERLANGVPGNFHPAEAVALAADIGASLLVAHHWGLFDFNTVDEPALAAALLAADPRLSWLRPEAGAVYHVPEEPS
jgi:L-ascorbate metabolism protein UlaG (beta-lactamase superfamily)